jgi:uncharacterized membrane protein YkoI
MYVDSTSAAQIAIKFFEQYNSNIIIEEVVSENDSWIVKVSIGMLTKQNKQVRIDARTGKILGYN